MVEYIFTLFKYEPAHQVKTDHARFVLLPALSEHEKKIIFLNESMVSADFG